MASDPNAHYVLERLTGKKILVTSKNYKDYRNSVEFIRLTDLVSEGKQETVKKSKKKATGKTTKASRTK